MNTSVWNISLLANILESFAVFLANPDNESIFSGENLNLGLSVSRIDQPQSLPSNYSENKVMDWFTRAEKNSYARVERMVFMEAELFPDVCKDKEGLHLIATLDELQISGLFMGDSDDTPLYVFDQRLSSVHPAEDVANIFIAEAYKFIKICNTYAEPKD
jgi:hypothetical protein